MSAATNSASSSAASAAGGTVGSASDLFSLSGLKNHAEEVFRELQGAASGSVSQPAQCHGAELALWDCVRRSILDDKSGRLAFNQFLRKERNFFASKDEVLRQERLVAALAAGEALGDDIEDDKDELKELKNKEKAALEEFRPFKLPLFKSIAASIVCSLGTENHPSALFRKQVATARSLPDGESLRHMQDVIKDVTALCWQAHGPGVAVDKKKQKQLNQDLDNANEDTDLLGDLKLLKAAARWATAWCLNEFEPKPKASKGTSSASPAPPLGRLPAFAADTASACVMLADVTALVEQRHVDSKSSQTELNVPVTITCDNLCAGQLIRMKASDCVVGGQIAHFAKKDGKKTVKLQEAKRGKCVTLVLKVLHQPGLLISEKPYTEMRITSFDEDDHSRWYKAMMMLDELRKAASPWVDRVMKDVWSDIKQELLNGSSKEDGSSLAASCLPYFPLLEKDGSYTLGDKTVAPTASEVLWFGAIMRRHADPAHTKVVNSQLKLWAHPDQGYIEVMKLFCNGLGNHDSSKKKRCVDDLDAEAVFKIICNCTAFHGVPAVPPSPQNPVKAAAKGAGFSRNTTIHVPTPNLSVKEFETVVEQLSTFEQMLVKCGVVGAGCNLVRNMKWMEANIADDKHKEILIAYQTIKELRHQHLRHDILDQLLPPQANTSGERQLLLQTSQDVIFKLRNDWAPGSREALKMAVMSHATAGGFRVKLLWLHAQRGRGKSSLMAQLIENSVWASGTCVVHHFFNRDYAASSLNIAFASLSVQLWHHFFKDDLDTAYTLFDTCLLASDGINLDVHELCAAVNRQSLIRITCEILVRLLQKIDGSVAAPISIVLVFDALDEVIHRLPQSNGSVSNFQNPHHALYSDIFEVLLPQVSSLNNVSVVVVASSTEPLLEIKYPFVHQIPVDDDSFLPAEDAHLIMTHKIKLNWPECKWKADVATILCELVPEKSPDLRFLDTRCKIVLQSAKKWMHNAQAVTTGDSIPADAKFVLEELVHRAGDMNLVQVVQVYVFQEMHFAFPGANLATWEQRIGVVFDFLVLVVFFGAVSCKIDLFEPFVCNSEVQTCADLEKILAETLSCIMLPARRVGYIQFQPEYIDALRSSALANYSNVREVMKLVYSGSCIGSSEHPSLLLSNELAKRFDCALFDEMSNCFAKASEWSERGNRILDAHEDLISRMSIYVETSCPCALLKIVQETVRRSGIFATLLIIPIDAQTERRYMQQYGPFGSLFAKMDARNNFRFASCGQDGDVQLWYFFSRVCDRLISYLKFDVSSGLGSTNKSLLQYQVNEVALNTAIILEKHLRFIGLHGDKLLEGIWHPNHFHHILVFLRSVAPGVDLPSLFNDVLPTSNDVDPSIMALIEGLKCPRKLSLFYWVVQNDPSQRSFIQQFMQDCGLSETDVWNVRLMLCLRSMKQCKQMLCEMKHCNVPEDDLTKSLKSKIMWREEMEIQRKKSLKVLMGRLDFPFGRNTQNDVSTVCMHGSVLDSNLRTILKQNFHHLCSAIAFPTFCDQSEDNSDCDSGDFNPFFDGIKCGDQFDKTSSADDNDSDNDVELDIKLIMEQVTGVDRDQALKSLQTHGYVPFHSAFIKTYFEFLMTCSSHQSFARFYIPATLWMQYLLYQNSFFKVLLSPN